MKTTLGIKDAKDILLSHARYDFKGQKEIMRVIAKEYNPKLDIDLYGGILWKMVFNLISVRCYRIASILLRYI